MPKFKPDTCGLDPVIQNRGWGKRRLDCRIKPGDDQVGRVLAKLLLSLPPVLSREHKGAEMRANPTAS